MKPALIAAVCTLALGALAPSLGAAPKPPAEVPDLPAGMNSEPVAAYRQQLLDQRAPLLERFQKWKGRADAFNQVYAGHEFEEGSKEAKDGAAEDEWLSTEGSAYQRAAGAFKSKVGKLSELLRLGAESDRIRARAAKAATPHVPASSIDTLPQS